MNSLACKRRFFRTFSTSQETVYWNSGRGGGREKNENKEQGDSSYPAQNLPFVSWKF